MVSFMIVVSSAQTSFFLFFCSPFLMTQLSAVNLHYRHILYSTACSALIDVKSQSYPFSEDFPHRRFDFSFANVGQPMPCKDHSEYFHTKFRHAFRIFFFTPGAKENVAFLKLSLKFLASSTFHCCLLYARKNYKSAQRFKLNFKKFKDMTASVLTSSINSQMSRKFRSNRYFTVVVNDFDGDSHDYEISAENQEEAGSIAESIAMNDGIQISYIEVY